MCRLSGRSKGSRKSDTPCSSLRRCAGKSGRRTLFPPVYSVTGSAVLCTHTLIIAETSLIHASFGTRGSAFQQFFGYFADKARRQAFSYVSVGHSLARACNIKLAFCTGYGNICKTPLFFHFVFFLKCTVDGEYSVLKSRNEYIFEFQSFGTVHCHHVYGAAVAVLVGGLNIIYKCYLFEIILQCAVGIALRKLCGIVYQLVKVVGSGSRFS